MSYHILLESDLSCERTIIYQTVHENFIVIVQQKRSHEKEEWITHDHCMLPKIFINFMAQLPVIPETTGSGFITSGGLYHQQHFCTLWRCRDIELTNRTYQ